MLANMAEQPAPVQQVAFLQADFGLCSLTCCRAVLLHLAMFAEFAQFAHSRADLLDLHMRAMCRSAILHARHTDTG